MGKLLPGHCQCDPCARCSFQCILIAHTGQFRYSTGCALGFFCNCQRYRIAGSDLGIGFNALCCHAACADAILFSILHCHSHAHALQCLSCIVFRHTRQVRHLVDFFPGTHRKGKHRVFHHHAARRNVLRQHYIFRQSRRVDRSRLRYLQGRILQPFLCIFNIGIDCIRHTGHSVRQLVYAHSPLKANDPNRQQHNQRNGRCSGYGNADFCPKRPPHKVNPPNTAHPTLYRLLGNKLLQKGICRLRPILHPNTQGVHQCVFKIFRKFIIIAGGIL